MSEWKSQRVHTRSNMLGQHGNLRCLVNSNLPKKQWIWLARNSPVTTASWQVYLYLSPFARTVCISQEQVYILYRSHSGTFFFFFLKETPQASSWNLNAVCYCCGLHLIPHICISCAYPTDELCELPFEHMDPKQVTAHRAMLAACPDFCLCRTSSFTHSPLPWACGVYM